MYLACLNRSIVGYQRKALLTLLIVFGIWFIFENVALDMMEFKNVNTTISTITSTSNENRIVVLQHTFDEYISHLATLSAEDIIINNITFYGLYNPALYSLLNNKTIFMRGDSMIKDLAGIFHAIFCNSTYKIDNIYRDIIISNLDMIGHLISNRHFVQNCVKKGINVTLVHQYSFSFDITSNDYDFIRTQPLNNKLDAVITDGYGLWLLQLHPVRDFKFKMNAIETILKYENGVYFQEWLDFAIKHQAKARSKNTCLIFMNTNWICYDKWSGSYKAAQRIYSQKNIRYNEYINECSNITETNSKLDRNKSTSVCQEYTFLNDGGVSAVNKLMRENVNKYQKLGFNVYLFDAYKLTKGKCFFTPFNDGRHYMHIMIFKMLGLVNFINNACG